MPTVQPDSANAASRPVTPAPPPGAVPGNPPAPGGRLRRLAMRGSLFEILGYGGAQLVRLASNMILTRLLFPEAFGLLAIVNILNLGLLLLSDVGIEPAVIQNSRGEDLRFLNTAWTIQVVRGFALYGIALALAYPLALVYQQPQLTWLICSGSFSVVIVGLQSTSMYTMRRRLQIGRLAIIELVAQVASTSVMVVWALLRPTVWVLVGGSLTFAAVRVVASYVVDVGYRNRLGVEREALQAIRHFGKWIFGSTAIYFISRQADRIVLGRLLGVAELGVYTIAVFMSEAVTALVQRVTQGVLYPALSRVREEGPERLRDAYYRARLLLDGVTQPMLGGLTALGPWVVHILYDSRYAAAGWILQVFAVRAAMMSVLMPCEACLISLGQTRYSLYQGLARLGWILLAVPVGWRFYGLAGIVVAAGLSELPAFFVLWPAFRAAGMLRLRVEARAAAFYLLGLGAGLLLARIR